MDHKFLKFLLLLGMALFALLEPAQAQAEVEVLDRDETFVFGESIQFWARFQSEIPIERVEVFYRPQSALRTLHGEATLEQSEAIFIHQIRENPREIPVFSTVEYRFLITLQNGETLFTETFQFEYQDNRFEWKSLVDSPFEVHWVEGDTAFGQAVADAARAGLRKAQNYFTITAPDELDIYVYPRPAEFQKALELTGLELVAGHASPELGVIMVSLPSGSPQDIEIHRQVPHELMHDLIFEKLGDSYTNVPTWLSEGLAMLNEASPNPDNPTILLNAASKNELLSMERLCRGFSKDPSLNQLSYAQSEAFTRFVYDNFGSPGLENLLLTYADGVECSRGVELTFGQSLGQLEKRWMDTFVSEVGIEQQLRELQPLLPWLVVLVSMLGVPVLLMIGGVARLRSQASKNESSS